MSDVIPFERPALSTKPHKQIPTLKDRFGDDDWLLKMCADWRATRAQQQKNWAEHDLATGWGYLPDNDISLDRDPLEQMQQLEFHLAESQPRTILLARELLRICVTILAHQQEHPESIMGHGPILEIVRNVVTSLEAIDGDMPIGRAALDKRRKYRSRKK